MLISQLNHRQSFSEVSVPRPAKVLFVCLHGAAKSVIAAEYLRRLARSTGRDLEATAAGVEPDDAIPSHVVSGLADDGCDVSGRTPQRLTDEELAGADIVISFGCSLETGSTPRQLITWDDIPAVSDGYGPARDAIIGRLRTFLADMSETDSGAARD
jgi:arsenate reductase (thioredoxin)